MLFKMALLTAILLAANRANSQKDTTGCEYAARWVTIKALVHGEYLFASDLVTTVTDEHGRVVNITSPHIFTRAKKNSTEESLTTAFLWREEFHQNCLYTYSSPAHGRYDATAVKWLGLVDMLRYDGRYLAVGEQTDDERDRLSRLVVAGKRSKLSAYPPAAFWLKIVYKIGTGNGKATINELVNDHYKSEKLAATFQAAVSGDDGGTYHKVYTETATAAEIDGKAALHAWVIEEEKAVSAT